MLAALKRFILSLREFTHPPELFLMNSAMLLHQKTHAEHRDVRVMIILHHILRSKDLLLRLLLFKRGFFLGGQSPHHGLLELLGPRFFLIMSLWLTVLNSDFSDAGNIRDAFLNWHLD